MFTFDGSYSFLTKDQTAGGADTISNSMLKFAGNFITVNSASDSCEAFNARINYRCKPSNVSGIE